MFRRLLTPVALGLALAATVAPVQPVQAEPKFSFATTPGQLPRDVLPVSYDVRLSLDPQSLTFAGSETIEIEVKQPTSTITLNALDLAVENAVLDGKLPGKLTIDSKNQTVSVAFAQPLAPGTHQLKLAFAGKASQRAEGLYYVRYDGGQKVMFGTQMEPTDARRMFPLWDEPVYRARFKLTVTVPENFTAVSNMPAEKETPLGNGLKEVAFAPSPKMSSYLVVLCAGEFDTLDDEIAGVKVRTVAVKGKGKNGRYAIDTLRQLLPYYNDYFGVPYPLPKLDQIAIPGGFGGAMENWGGITYNESALLYDPQTSSQSTKESVHNIVSHEVAHQWFGNLVTMAWWDNLWLNEGFASWMDTKATEKFNPSWEYQLRAASARDNAMQSDAKRTTHPIQQPVKDPAEAASQFDEITYQKGEAIIRMLEAFLGEDTFRDGIRRYMKAHAYSNTTTADLWEALEQASGQPVRAIAATWTEQPGFPIVTVSARCEKGERVLSLRQERFTINDPSAKPLTWKVPVTFGRPGSGSVQSYLLADKSGMTRIAGCDGPIKLNLGNTGYYRVRYTGELLAQLKQNFTKLAAADRVNLLSDTWAGVQAGQAKASEYLALAEVARNDTNLAVWQQMLASLGELDRLQIGRAERATFQNYGRSLLQPLYNRLGWDARPDEPATTGVLRSSLLGTLGRFGDEKVIAQARRRFAAFIKDPASLSPNLRAPVLYIAGRYADSQAWETLHSLGLKTNSTEEKKLYYGAMSSALDPKLASKTLDIALGDELEPNFAANLVQQVAKNGEHAELAWNFARENYKVLLDKIAFYSRYKYLPTLASNFTDPARVAELERFAEQILPPEALPEVRKGAETILTSASVKQRQLPNLDGWACNRSAGKNGKNARFCLDVN